MERRLALPDPRYPGFIDVYSYRVDAVERERCRGAESNVAEPYDRNGAASNGHDNRGRARAIINYEETGMTAGRMPSTSIVIVNRYGGSVLRDCIESVPAIMKSQNEPRMRCVG